MTPRAEKIAVALILAASFILFSVYSLATPVFEASDELWHYPFIQHLAAGGGLPVQHKDQTDADAPWRQEGSQPPLFYALAALATAPFDSSNWRDIRRLNPHADMGVPARDGNANVILHTPAEQFPWSRAVLAVRVARLVSILLSTLTVFFAYRVARELFTDTRLRLASMVFTAGVPMFAFISGSVNNDNAAVMFSTLGVWWALRLVRRQDTSWRTAAIAGIIAGLGALSKSSTLGLAALFGLAGLLAAISNARRQASGVKRQASILMFDVARFTFVLLAAAALVSGWWFVRNQILYGDVLGWNAFLDSVGRRSPPAGLAQLWTEREGFVWAYWGVFGALNVIFPPWVYAVLNGIAAVASVGLAWDVIRQVKGKKRNYAAPIACLLWAGLVFIALLRWTSLTPASQGRLMFPAIAVIAAGIAYGLSRIHRVCLVAGMAIVAAVAVAAPFTVIAPAYAQPPNLAVADPAQRLDATFGGQLDLLGFDAPNSNLAHPGDDVTLNLYWQLRQPFDRNYSVFVHLIDENGVIVAQRDMYPGQGSIATSEAPPGYAWRDRYTLRIPRLALTPAHLSWAVGVYDLTSGERLPLARGDGSVVDDDKAVQFGQLELAGRQDRDGAPLLDYPNGITLAGYDVRPRALTAGAPVTVTLVWRATGKVAHDYTVSLQILDDAADKVAQHDSAPMNGAAPTSSWANGSTVTDTHVLRVGNDAPTGVYRLLLVLYSPQDFSRLGVYGTDGQYAGDEITLTRLRLR